MTHQLSRPIVSKKVFIYGKKLIMYCNILIWTLYMYIYKIYIYGVFHLYRHEEIGKDGQQRRSSWPSRHHKRPSQGEEVEEHIYSRCHELDHTRNVCQNPALVTIASSSRVFDWSKGRLSTHIGHGHQPCKLTKLFIMIRIIFHLHRIIT